MCVYVCVCVCACVRFCISCVCFVRVFRVRFTYRVCVFPMRFHELAACVSAFVVRVLCMFRVVCVCVSFLYIVNTFLMNLLCVFLF